MDKELIEQLALKSGAQLELLGGEESTRVAVCFEADHRGGRNHYPSLHRFAALIADECAKLCDAAYAQAENNYRRAVRENPLELNVSLLATGSVAQNLAAAIRAKFQP